MFWRHSHQRGRQHRWGHPSWNTVAIGDCARPFADDCGRSGNTHPYAETSGGTQTGGFLLGIMAAVVPLLL